MKAVMALQPGVLTLADLPCPVPGQYEALVRLDACAICNSTDHKLATNEFFPGPFPVILGHEAVGTVVEIGPGVRNFGPGDRVFRQRLADASAPEGGRSCWGGFAEYGIVTDAWAREGLPYGPEHLPHDQQKLLIDVEPGLASGMVTLMETLDCLLTCGVAPGTPLAIVGSGPVAQAFACLAKLLGAGPVIAFARTQRAARRFADIAHADGYVLTDSTAYPQDIRRILARGGFSIVLEAVGSPDALDTAIALAGKAGQVNVYGVAPESSAFRPDQLSRSNVRMVGAVEGRTQSRLVRYIEAGDLRLADWVTHCLPFSDYQQGFDLVAGKRADKVALLPGA